MPASANWPERTLISPILTVPCALADETPSTSATAQPSPTRIRFIVILPACSLPNNCKKIVLMKVCAVEKFDGRGGGHRPTSATASAAAAMLDRARVFAPSTQRTSRDRDMPSSKREHWRAPHGRAAADICRGKGLGPLPIETCAGGKRGQVELVVQRGGRCSKPLK